MGEVYQAFDTELGRLVAIKILPAHLSTDSNRLQRFIQEAKAASALNHPHILTIHDVGTDSNSRFIATEFIDGATLRQRMQSGMKLAEMLEVAIETTSALAAAHEAGIIHRDIKPENIMVRRDGYVKVLDFGLAKLTEAPGTTTDTEAPTKAMVNTGAGTVMGTTNYMSPEQAKGTHVDTRTDLWSVGVLLYEMLSGHLPFNGETPTETISLILQKEPPPLMRYVPATPAELDRIITKALTKDRDERYQTAKDLLIDLRNLKRRLEVDAEIDRTTPPEVRAATTSGSSTAGTASGMGAATVGASDHHSVSNAEYIVSEIKSHKKGAIVVALVIVVAAAGIIAAFARYWHARNSEVAIESIAVLPFENQSRESETEYMSDGLTDSIINSLTQLPNLKVIARSSVFRYKGKQADPLVVAKDLGVRAILTGRILQHGDNVTISTELIDARDNKQLWGEQYERKLSDLMMVQRDIAHEITNNLKLKLSPAEQGMMAKHYTENPEAFQLYMKGRFYWNKRSQEGIQKSVEYFNQAIAVDPNFAQAYAGLADSWLTAGWYRDVPPQESRSRSLAAIDKAVALDPTLAEPHATLGTVKMLFEWDWAGAEQEFKKAIEMNPRYPTAHQRYSLFLPIVGRIEEAVAEAKKAKDLDPLSLSVNENVGDILCLAERYDEAEQQLLKTIELDPTFELAHQTLARVYAAKGDEEKSLDEQMIGAPADVIAHAKRIYAESGMAGVWRERLNRQLERAKSGHADAMAIAFIYVKLNDIDKSFEWLNKALDERGVPLTYVVADPRWAKVRADPRYTAMLQRLGLQK